MDEQAVDKVYDAILKILDGEEYETIMIVLGALHNVFALRQTLDETRLRELYSMMGDAAVCMAMMDDDAELQASKNSPQKTKRTKTRKAPRNESGPFGFN